MHWYRSKRKIKESLKEQVKSKVRKICVVTGITTLLLLGYFCLGRYGWKLLRFTFCEGAGIEQVEVQDNQVHIKGFYPGSFPSGFCGYYAEEKNGVLYVGFRFSPVFGFFETGNIDVTIPTREKVKQVVLKTGKREYVLTERTEEGTYERPDFEPNWDSGEAAVEEP